MKSCRDFEGLLSLFAGGELEVEQAAQVAAHLETCMVCREKVAVYKNLTSHLSAMRPPTLPDSLFENFYVGVKEKITADVEARGKALGLVALLHALHRHRRLAWVALALVVMITSSALFLMQRFQPTSQSQQSLTQLLERREWDGLYHAMRKNETMLRLLDEPVPVKLLQTALTELVIAQKQDRKLREGLERILTSLPISRGKISKLGRPAQLLGKITAAGYQAAMTARPVQSDPEALLQNLLQIGTDKTVTLRELLLKTRFL